MPSRVVITGLGVVSPIGIGVDQFWQTALAGKSGISAIPSFGDFPMESYRSRVAGRVENFNAADYIDDKFASRVDRYAQFGLVSTKEALDDSGLQMDKIPAERIGVAVGAGMGGMVMGEREITQLYENAKPHRVHPNFIPTITLNSASGIIAQWRTGRKARISPSRRPARRVCMPLARRFPGFGMAKPMWSSLWELTPALLRWSLPGFVPYGPCPPGTMKPQKKLHVRLTAVGMGS